MAYHSARSRDPLIDSTTQAVLEKRGTELLGFVLMAVGLLFTLMIWSYSPEDPNWLAASDAPVQNYLGVTGASVAAPLFLILGWGSLSIGIIIMGWGLRCVLHNGLDRAFGRVIFAPIAVALMSVYASTLVKSAEWTHSFGLGGLFGDMVVGGLLTFLPLPLRAGLILVSFLAAVAMIALMLFVLGFVRHEIQRGVHFLLLGLVMSYATVMSYLGRGANGAIRAAKDINETRQQRRSHDVAFTSAPATSSSDQAMPIPRAPVGSDVLDETDIEFQEKTSFLARMPALIKRAEKLPEPELVEPQAVADVAEMPGDDRIQAKISDVIKNRVVAKKPATVDQEATLTKGRGRGPDPLVLSERKEPVLRAEPQMRATDPVPTEEAAIQPTVAEVEAPLDAYQDSYMSEDFVPEGYDEMAEPMGYDEPLQTEPYAEEYGSHEPMAPIPTYEPKKIVQPLMRKPIQPSTRAKAEAQPSLKFEEPAQVSYDLPPLNLLMNPEEIERLHLSDEALEENARLLESVLDDYGVKGEIVSVRPGPVVTMYELEPAPGLKASRVIGLADDIARSMSALSARVSTVPGRSVIGIELPNENREKVVLREILSSRSFGDGGQKLPLALGKDIGGEPIVANLAKMPHLLIAGTTGSGKSVAINTMILSLLYKLTPEECRLIMIDPKMLELSVYDGIPHLLSPVVTDPKKAVVALKWVVGEMEERYRKMSKMGVRNIDGYNGRVQDALSRNEMFSRTIQTGFDDQTGDPIFETEEFQPEKMPYIVVIVDEMADLMMVAGKEIEACIQRLAQMARASGIHLIMATQRPSVDVITGTIKANFPTRISFQVTSKIDSRTILGEMGAEQLLGMGDMLYMAGGSKITRCHGPFVSDEEVEEIVNHLKAYGPPEYMSGVVEGPDDEKADNIDMVLGLGGNTEGEDALYDQAVAIVLKDRKVSTSYIQRKLSIGYNKAARLVEQMEDEGLISAANHVGKREILVPEQQ